MNANDLDLCTILWATITHVVGNLDEILPRHDDVIPVSSASIVAIGYDKLAATVAVAVLMATR
jgi:hypothetical protein